MYIGKIYIFLKYNAVIKMFEANIKVDEVSSHPCFSEEAHFKYSRVHLPLAVKCNIQCNYCRRGIDKSIIRPGLTARILSVDEAVKYVDELVRRDSRLKVIAVAGPGEPLYNMETFDALKIIHEKYPDKNICIATNGLNLIENIDRIRSIGVKTLTITINAINPEIASKIYEYVIIDGRRRSDAEAYRVFIHNQLEGLKAAVNAGIAVKVNTVLIPGINMDHVVEVARKAAELGAYIQNIIPLIPLYRFRKLKPPTCEELRLAREKCEKYIKQFRLCKMCRADAYGIPGLESSYVSALYRNYMLLLHAGYRSFHG